MDHLIPIQTTPAIEFIRQKFNWDDPKMMYVMGNLSSSNITVDDMAQLLGVSVEEVQQNLEKRPHLKAAYLTGPKIADAQVASRVFDKALSGDLAAANMWLNNKMSKPSLDREPEIIDSDDPMDFLESNVMTIVKKGFKEALDTKDLGKVNAFLNTVLDRVYGKPVQQINQNIREQSIQKIEVVFGGPEKLVE